MEALRSGNQEERACVRAIAKDIISRLPTLPEGLKVPPVVGKPLLLVGPLLQAAWSYMERTAFMCWLKHGTDRQVWDQEVGSAVMSICLYKAVSWLGAGGLA